MPEPASEGWSIDQLIKWCATAPIDEIRVAPPALGPGRLSFLTLDHLLALLLSDSTGRLRPLHDTNGKSIGQNVGEPDAFLADGTTTTTEYGWRAMKPVTVTADGAGQIAAAVELIAASAGYRIDAHLTMKVRTVAGAAQYSHKFCEDTGGTPAAITPDWFASAVVIPHAANETFPGDNDGIHITTITAGMNLGVPTQGAGAWPNSAAVTFSGRYRYVV